MLEWVQGRLGRAQVLLWMVLVVAGAAFLAWLVGLLPR